VSAIGVIGGTGLNELEGLEVLEQHHPQTPWGEPSAGILEGEYRQQRLFFLARHGTPHQIPPDRINYRANIWALRELGVKDIVAVNAVGGIQSVMSPGDLVIPDQLIDYTWGRSHSFSDGVGAELQHVDFTHPYTPGLCAELLAAIESVDRHIPHYCTGTYGATQGPRLETSAEIRRMQRDGCDVVGMTGMPEAALARELGLAYACMCMVVNPAAGLSDVPITMEDIEAVLHRNAALIGEILALLLQKRAQTHRASP
jgi:5'-methylthioinosine phosphorylase